MVSVRNYAIYDDNQLKTHTTISEISWWILISKPWEPDQRLMRWPFAQDRHIELTNFTFYRILLYPFRYSNINIPCNKEGKKTSINLDKKDQKK